MKKYALPYFSLDLTPLWKVPHPPEAKDYSPLLLESHTKLFKKFTSKQVGFFDWPLNIEKRELDSIQECARRLRTEFQGALICGIGGSHLGAAAIIEALREIKDEEGFPFFWLHNIDPWSIAQAKHFVKKRRAATLLISKSGNTIETLSGYFHLSPFLEKKGTVIITDPLTGELRRLVSSEGFQSFSVPANIGGRFSVLTSVGLFPLALGNINIEECLNGATEMRKALLSFSATENPAYQYALYKFLWDTQRNHGIQYLMPYHSSLRMLGDWYVQLWGESLGKKTLEGKEVGATFVSALGTRDQHSLLQLFKEGPKNKLVGFVDIASEHDKSAVGKPPFASPAFECLALKSFGELSSKALAATQRSLNGAGVPTYNFLLEELSPRALGAFLLFQETACAFAGELYRIDAFNQPGVEEAKRLLIESL